MGLKNWLLPRNRTLFDRLEAAAANTAACAIELQALFADYGGLAERRQRMKDLEHTGDQIAHGLFDELARTIHTPIDREEIARVARSLDDVADAIYGATNRLFVYAVAKPTADMGQFAALLVPQTRLLGEALRHIREPKTFAAAQDAIVEVHRLEQEADRLLNETLANLFRTNDPMVILKQKEIYETLEAATDRCADVADVIGDIVQLGS